MKTCKVSEIFDIQYGHSLELISLEKNSNGINFVSRTSKNNGVSAKVKEILSIEPMPAGTLTVAVGGSVMETFLQLAPYYTGFHVLVLTPKVHMSNEIKLYYCMCLQKNKYKFSYGRQANVTLPDLQIPTLDDVPQYVLGFSTKEYGKDLLNKPIFQDVAVNNQGTPNVVPLGNLFEVVNGIASAQVIRSNKKETEKWVPYIRPSYRQETSIGAYTNTNLLADNKIFPKDTLYVSTNGQGSHSFSYVSTSEFVPNSDVSVLIPKRAMSLQEKLFYAQCITNNRYKFSYGRKPKGNRLKEILIPEYPPEYVINFNVGKILNSFDDILEIV